jgi:hypothetical protein
VLLQEPVLLEYLALVLVPLVLVEQQEQSWERVLVQEQCSELLKEPVLALVALEQESMGVLQVA